MAAVALPWLPGLDGPPEAAPTRRASGCRGTAIWRLAVSPDGRTIATVDEQRRVRLQPAAEGCGRSRELDVCTLANTIAFSPDGRYLAVGGADPDVVLFDLVEGGPGRRLGISVSEPSCLCFSPDGRILAVASVASPEILLWDIEGGGLRLTLRADSSPVTHLAFGPDGRSLTAVSAPDNAPGRVPVIPIWDLPTGRRRAHLTEGWVVSCAFSADGRLLAMTNSDLRRIELLEMPTGRPVGPSIVTPGPVYSIAVSPDARWLATVVGGRQMSVWSLETAREVRRLDGQAESLYCLAFSPDGTTLAVAGSDGDIRLWDLRIEAPDGDTESRAADDPGTGAGIRRQDAESGSAIENGHRGPEPVCGAARALRRSVWPLSISHFRSESDRQP
jgi:COMPASS component SWD3